MGDILKKPYEISIWEDIGIGEGEEKRYFEEELIAVIGSDTMDTPIKAMKPILSMNINGVKTLTFSIFSRYLDEDQNEMVENPFISLLVNERKLKLHYDGEWYDFVIKNIQENSTDNTFTYTAQDLHIDELSKTGFQIELNSELENNQGTVIELGERILEGSDWRLADGESDIIRQTIKEPLYEITLDTTIQGIDMLTGDIINVAANEVVYGFYNTIMEKEEFFQFLYRADGLYEIDDDRIILNSPNYRYSGNMTYKIPEGEYGPIPTIHKGDETPPISKKYRGERLVRQQITQYDSSVDKFVKVYKEKDTLEKIYGFEETEYLSSEIVRNFITNGSDFDTINGWLTGADNITIEPKLYPNPLDYLNDNTQVFNSYLKVKFYGKKSILNTGVRDNRAFINNFAKGEEYVFRVKYGVGNSTPTGNPASYIKPTIKVSSYKSEETGFKEEINYFTFSNPVLVDGYYVYTAQAKESLSLREMVENNIGIFISLQMGDNDTSIPYWFEDIQLFKLYLDSNNEMIVLEDVPEAVIKTTYYYYKPNPSYKSTDDINFVYKDYKLAEELYEAVYDTDYSKIRSITATESNRYNLLQSLAETFECWIKFEVEHEPTTGKILRDSDGRLKKWISFHNYIGEDNSRGFKYGVNLKAIRRDVVSDQIVSKLIVKPNSNEYAIDGFATIQRASENLIKENFLLNFNHYIQQGLLSYAELNNDLYNTNPQWIGYYTHLREINRERDVLIKELSALSVNVSELEANYRVEVLKREGAAEELAKNKYELKLLTGHNYEEFIVTNPDAKITKWTSNEGAQGYLVAIQQNQYILTKYSSLATQTESRINTLREKIETLTAELEEKVEEKKTLDKRFYDKYSTFLKEGSWISEEYIDDNLYYLDAESVLYTSAAPQINYSIDVLELSQIADYENYKFSLGDKTYIEDTEFFGWVYSAEGQKTPYQEEIVISQISYSLDSPEENKITVQNYKNQFEDLFQRITAITQAVQYKSGEYGRAASVVNPDGSITTGALRNTLINNEFIISNATDQSVVWDDTGITITNFRFPNQIVRLTSQGILLTIDGGLTWSAGITGAGMNANFLTAGQIDTAKINIMSGEFPSFKWDGNGLHAYTFTRDELANPRWFNYSQFIRFDQYGIYGFSGDDEFIPQNTNDVLTNEGTRFALTWEGLFLRGDGADQYLKLNAKDHFIVMDNGVEKVKLGRLPATIEGGGEAYGLRLRNSQGEVVLDQTNTGSLYLKELLQIGPDIANYNPRVQLGVINTENKNGNLVSKILEVNNIDGTEQIAIYDDGLLKAVNVDLKGAIYATSGQIGNVTIDEVAEAAESLKGIRIQSQKGESFKVKDNVAFPEKLDLVAELTNVKEANPNTYEWYGSSSFEDLINPTAEFRLKKPSGEEWDISNIDFFYDDYKTEFDENNRYYVKVQVLGEDGKTYSDFITLTALADGAKGEPGADGAKGEPGADGRDGEDGEGILSTTVEYKNSTSGDTPPTGQWSTTPIEPIQRQYLWTRTVITYTKDSTPSVSYSVAYSPADGDSIVDSTVEYLIHNIGTGDLPEEGWSPTVPTLVKGQYLWTRTITRYEIAEDVTTYSVSYIALDGLEGPPGADGQWGVVIQPDPPDDEVIWVDPTEEYPPIITDGQDGVSSYLHIRYSDYSDGTDFDEFSENKKYMGIATTNSEVAPVLKTEYSWSLIKGTDGEDGKQYILNTNQDRILKFVKQDTLEADTYIALSPPTLTLSLDINEGGAFRNLLTTEYDVSFEIQGRLVDVTDDEIPLMSSLDFLKEKEVIITQGLANLKWEIDLQAINNLDEASVADIDSLDESEKAQLLRLKEKLLNEETFLFVHFFEKDTHKRIMTHPISVTFGLSQEMAKFSVEVEKINAAVDSTNLTFTRSGLTLKNGAFSIVSEEGENLLYSEDGYLAMRGNVYADDGYFRGTIEATGGVFTGSINAEDGQLKDLEVIGRLQVDDLSIDGRENIETLQRTKTFVSYTEHGVGWGIDSFDGFSQLSAPVYFGFEEKALYRVVVVDFDTDEVLFTYTDEAQMIAYSLQAEDGQLKNYEGIGLISEELEDLFIIVDSDSPEGSIVLLKEQYASANAQIEVFKIEPNPLLGISAKYEEDGSKGFLISNNGDIFANSIVLGSAAQISKYLRLGNSWILNPTAFDKLDANEIAESNATEQDFIILNHDTGAGLVKTLAINKEGLIRIGNDENGITINGILSSIQSNNYAAGTGWKIDQEEAIFNNAIIRGSISASVLEYSEAQAVGGMMVVRPSSTIKTIRVSDENYFTLSLENADPIEGKYSFIQNELYNFKKGSAYTVTIENNEGELSSYTGVATEIEETVGDLSILGVGLKIESPYILMCNTSQDDLEEIVIITDTNYSGMVVNIVEHNILVSLENRNGFFNDDLVYMDLGDGNRYYFLVDLGNIAPVQEEYFASNGADGIYRTPGADGAEIRLFGSKVSTLLNKVDDLVGKPIINFGRTGEVGIGINSSQNKSLVPAQSVSVFDITTEEENLQILPKVVLGKIPDGSRYGSLAGEYGLYAENVLLEGSLIAKRTDSLGSLIYSGINTLSSIVENNNPISGEEKGDIIIWAGAKGDSDADIANAKFRIDSYGNLYAEQGFFRGSILSDAIITATEIRTAVLTGWKREDGDTSSGGEAALTIRDTHQGIHFEDNGKKRFKLDSSLMSIKMNMELSSGYVFNSSSPFTAPKLLIFNEEPNIAVALENDRIGFTSNKSYSGDIAYKSYITFKDGLEIHDGTSLDVKVAHFKRSETKLSNDVYLQENLVLGDQMEFNKIVDENVVVGYDIYLRN